jgi:subtilisin family serine protease
MNSIIQALIIIVLIASLVQSAVLKPRNVDQHPLMLTSNRRSTPLPLWPELSGGNSNIIPTQFLIQLIPSITRKSSIKISTQFLIKIVSSHQASFLSQFTQQYPDVELLNTFDIGDLQAYAIQLPTDNAALAERALEELRYQPDIERIEYNQLCNATAVQINAPWNLDRISKRNQTLTGNYTFADQAGAGVDVYVLDTGVRVTHVEFEGRARFGASFNGQPGTGDDNGHGTHVAGTLSSFIL